MIRLFAPYAVLGTLCGAEGEEVEEAELGRRTARVLTRSGLAGEMKKAPEPAPLEDKRDEAVDGRRSARRPTA